MAFVEEAIPPSSRSVLDAGCGSGEDLRYLSTTGWDLLAGVDTSAAMVGLAQSALNGRAEILRASIDELPYQPEQFDVILSRFALHYLDATAPAYREFFRCLRQQGTLICIVPHPSFFDACRDADRPDFVRTRPFEGAVELTYPYRALTHFLSAPFFSLFRLVQIREFRIEATLPFPSALGFVAVKADLPRSDEASSRRSHT